MLGYAVIDTAIGACAVAWGPVGITGVQLPEGDAEKTRGRLLHHHPDATEQAPPPDIAAAIAAITALLEGEHVDLSAIALDTTRVPPFARRVYEVARTIPPAETLTYGAIAERIGAPGEARAVGQALGHNPFPLIVPCHRVVAAGGKTGGFSARGGVATKLRLLEIERAHAHAGQTLF
jgi:methylated-DNA-[protein]-cysteine S-methyltransferase